MKVLEPTGSISSSEKTVVPRMSSLHGKRLGILWNGRRPGPSEAILKAVASELESRHELSATFIKMKPYIGNVASAEMLDGVAASADFAITGVGD